MLVERRSCRPGCARALASLLELERTLLAALEPGDQRDLAGLLRNHALVYAPRPMMHS